MEETARKFNLVDWLLFIVSFVVCVAMLIWMDRFFWIALPFVGVFLIKALRVM